jgi:hypothetical protein
VLPGHEVHTAVHVRHPVNQPIDHRLVANVQPNATNLKAKDSGRAGLTVSKEPDQMLTSKKTAKTAAIHCRKLS